MKKLYFVSGGDGILGTEVTKNALRMGNFVISHQRNPRKQESCTDIDKATQEERLLVTTGDLSQSECMLDVMKKIQSHPLPLHGVINAAGSFLYKNCEETTEEDFHSILTSNLMTSWNIAKHVIPYFKDKKKGRMVFVSSAKTEGEGVAGLSLYLAAKAGLNQLVKCLAHEFSNSDMKINAVLPSIIDTPFNRQVMPDSDWKQWIKPDDLAQFILNICEPEFGLINGSLISVY